MMTTYLSNSAAALGLWGTIGEASHQTIMKFPSLSSRISRYSRVCTSSDGFQVLAWAGVEALLNAMAKTRRNAANCAVDCHVLIFPIIPSAARNSRLKIPYRLPLRRCHVPAAGQTDVWRGLPLLPDRP